MTALLVLFTILVFLTVDYLSTRRARNRVVSVAEFAGAAPSAAISRVPEKTLCSPGHVWIRPEDRGAVRIGVDKVLLSLLGGVKCLYANPEGTPVRIGGPLVMLRNGNRALQIRSPLDGVIAGVNPVARTDPDRIGEDPYQNGWIYEIKPSVSGTSLKGLIGGGESPTWMQGEFERLRDLVVDLAGRAPEGQAILADGGLPVEELQNHIGSRIDDEDWKDLVKRFFE